MTSNPVSDIMTALDALLERERAALLSGDLDRLPELLHEKTALIDALAGLDAAAEPLPEALKEKALRNQALLDGALEGIRHVAGRIAALRRLRQSFETYDETGRRRTIEGDIVRRIEKRA